jgi:hypothetical protein
MNGPGDAGPTAAGQTILDFAAGKLPGVVDVQLSYVDARDVAQACVEAVECAPRSERYVVAGRRVHLGDAYRILERTLGVPAPTRRVPLALLAVVAAMNELWARISGRPVLIGTAMFRTLREEGPYNSYDSSKAERALGVRFRPLEATLRDAAAWLSKGGILVPRGGPTARVLPHADRPGSPVSRKPGQVRCAVARPERWGYPARRPRRHCRRPRTEEPCRMFQEPPLRAGGGLTQASRSRSCSSSSPRR